MNFVVTSLLAAVTSTGSANALETLACVGTDEQQMERRFSLSFNRQDTLLRDISFVGDAPLIDGVWSGQENGGNAVLRAQAAFGGGEVAFIRNGVDGITLRWTSYIGFGDDVIWDRGSADCSSTNGENLMDRVK